MNIGNLPAGAHAMRGEGILKTWVDARCVLAHRYHETFFLLPSTSQLNRRLVHAIEKTTRHKFIECTVVVLEDVAALVPALSGPFRFWLASAPEAAIARTWPPATPHYLVPCPRSRGQAPQNLVASRFAH
jgi:hypothetical protein